MNTGMEEIPGTHLCKFSTIVHNLTSDFQSLLGLPDTHPITYQCQDQYLMINTGSGLFLRCGFSWTWQFSGREKAWRKCKDEASQHYLYSLSLNLLVINIALPTFVSALYPLVGDHVFYVLYRINLQYPAGEGDTVILILIVQGKWGEFGIINIQPLPLLALPETSAPNFLFLGEFCEANCTALQFCPPSGSRIQQIHSNVTTDIWK